MKLCSISVFFGLLLSGLLPQASEAQALSKPAFDRDTDLLLVQMDCKTDVDDIHTAAALYMLMSHPEFKNLSYLPVAGTYGVQEGLYVPPGEVLDLAFGKKWADADANRAKALAQVYKRVKKTLKSGGEVWIAEAGQSDFSALLIREIQSSMPEVALAERIHVVQHSNWNEEVTSKESLAFVKSTIDYHKIPDGNAVGNGTPGFRTPGYSQWEAQLSDPKLKAVWQLAVAVGLRYNGIDGRYDNKAVAENGLDFSDLSEVCYILGLSEIKDTDEFFNRFAQ
ncbi:hypothetical protein J0A68_20595 [Algoriphagus sp. H41]|uniref:DUF1593 domain-containing protein n=1 Tax=Algoriphagus oliviformis TaxID=2811231 RepID=A0ABS3C8C6_9BACT|nr:hypothetical protein [Algoriphagus oliviformis]MBN7813366.1 hypothetical protein [Algoriphagus oliviformis]